MFKEGFEGLNELGKLGKAIALLVSISLMLAMLPTVSFGTTTSGIISGHVTSEVTGEGVSKVKVTLYPVNADGSNDYCRAKIYVYTNSSGYYESTNTAPGLYKIRFTPPSTTGLQIEYFNDKKAFETSDMVNVPSGGSVVIDEALEQAGTVSGHVTNGITGNPSAGVKVTLYPVYSNGKPDYSRDRIYLYTDSNGNFKATYIVPGLYKIRYTPPDGTHLQIEYFNDKKSWDFADIITVLPAETFIADEVLEEGATLFGHVQCAAGNPIKDVKVTIYPVTGSGVRDLGRDRIYAYTDASGNYRIEYLVPGLYKIMFTPKEGTPLQQEYFDNKTTFSDATILTIGAEEETEASAVLELTSCDRPGIYVETDEDTPVEITLLESSATVCNITNPSHGSLSDVVNNKVIYTPDPNYSGPDGFTFKTSNCSDVKTVAINVRPANDLPEINVAMPTVFVNEGQEATNTGRWSDIDGDDVSIGASIGSVTKSVNRWNWSYLAVDGPDSSQGVTLTADDGNGGIGSASFELIVNNVAPTISSITTTSAARLSIDVSANFSDPGILDTHTGIWEWGDGTTSTATIAEANGSGSATGSHTYSSPGSYTITLTIADKDGGVGEASIQYVTPGCTPPPPSDEGKRFVTGGGWFNSLPGMYMPDKSLKGKLSFGFVAKCLPKSKTPEGEAEIQFRAADMNFHSTKYKSLVIEGERAVFEGEGKINGENGYAFYIVAIDGQKAGGGGTDKIRIRIWKKSDRKIVYDNMPGKALSAEPKVALVGGSIVIH